MYVLVRGWRVDWRKQTILNDEGSTNMLGIGRLYELLLGSPIDRANISLEFPVSVINVVDFKRNERGSRSEDSSICNPTYWSTEPKFRHFNFVTLKYSLMEKFSISYLGLLISVVLTRAAADVVFA